MLQEKYRLVDLDDDAESSELKWYYERVIEWIMKIIISDMVGSDVDTDQPDAYKRLS